MRFAAILCAAALMGGSAGAQTAPPIAPVPHVFAAPSPPAPRLVRWTAYHGATEIQVRDAAAVLHITTEARPDVAISIENHGRVRAPTIRRSGDRLIIDGRQRRVGQCRSDSVVLPQLGRVPYAELPIITVRMPRDAVISTSGAVRTRIGPMRSARLSFAGCGETIFGGVDGALNLALAGSGDVRGGGVGSAELRVAGSGDVVLGAVADGLTVSIVGASSVRTGAVLSGDLRIAVQGGGDVVMGGGRVEAVTVLVSGSGDVIFPGVARSLDAVVAGSGDVVIGSVTGPVTRRVAGSGDVIVGR